MAYHVGVGVLTVVSAATIFLKNTTSLENSN